MSDAQPSKSDLLREGLKSYRDAKYAIRTFENEIQNVALSVMTANLASIENALASAEISVSDISPWAEDGELGQVEIGAVGKGYTWEEGLRLGIGWQMAPEHDALRPIVCLSIRVGADRKKKTIFGALKKMSLDDPRKGMCVEERHTSPMEVSVHLPLPEKADITGIKELMITVVDRFVEWNKSFGGLRSLLYGENRDR